ncbi:MAG: hypothetical protein CMH32_08530 [Micavibrio sp.]|mgnify:FL=1|nr:hypothetical protein [Micavibrio sp.]
MIFAIFTLSLACSMSFCPMQAHAKEASEQTKSDLPPCHESNEQSTDCDFMSNMDCLGIDLAQIDNSYDLVQDSSDVDFVWANLAIDYNDFLYRPNVIRGPPFESANKLPSRPLYLTTQRFRI